MKGMAKHVQHVQTCCIVNQCMPLCPTPCRLHPLQWAPGIPAHICHRVQAAHTPASKVAGSGGFSSKARAVACQGLCADRQWPERSHSWCAEQCVRSAGGSQCTCDRGRIVCMLESHHIAQENVKAKPEGKLGSLTVVLWGVGCNILLQVVAVTCCLRMRYAGRSNNNLDCESGCSSQ